MSDINANATVTLTVNGKQAQNMLEQLKKQAVELEDKITKAAAAGDKVQLKRFQRELRQTHRQIAQIESATQGVENVMKRLDQASPKELSRTLRELKKQLNGIERGSAAWQEKCEQIRAVKQEYFICYTTEKIPFLRTFLGGGGVKKLTLPMRNFYPSTKKIPNNGQ